MKEYLAHGLAALGWLVVATAFYWGLVALSVATDIYDVAW